MGIYDRDYYREDELRPIRPWDNRSMVSLLIIANVAVFVLDFLTKSSVGRLTDALELRPQDLYHPLQWYRTLTYGFCHDYRGIGHILFNMLTLYFLGQGVEHKYGKWEFLRIYLVSIVLCGFVWLGVRGGADGPGVIGASGAVTTIAMLFVFSYPQSTLMIYGVVPVKAWVIGIVLVVSNLFGRQAYVAYDVHLVGAAFAAVYFYGGLNFGFLESWWGSTQTSIAQKRKGFKVHRGDSHTPDDSDARGTSSETKDEIEANLILDKIHREGQDSLTARERKFMENYSRKLRQRRGL